jgi:hypothetical protein
MGTGALADGTLMDKQYPPEAWKRLGKALEAHRARLGYGFRQRGRFLADHGGPPPSAKMLARLERGERATYPDSTITLLESLYGLAPGSFEKVLAGEALGGSHPPPAPGPQPEFPGFDGEPEGDEAWILFPDDERKRHIWRTPRMSHEDRVELIAFIDRRRAEVHGGGEGPRREAHAS